MIYIIDHEKLYNDGVERTPKWFKHLLQVLSNRLSSENSVRTIAEKINALRSEQAKEGLTPKPLGKFFRT